MVQDKTKVAITHQQEVTYAHSVNTEIKDLVICFRYTTALLVSYRAHDTNLNEDKLILSVAKI